MKRYYYFTKDDRFNPPDPVELTPEDDFTETIELNLDAIVVVDNHGMWTYEDETYGWAKCSDTSDGSWYTDEYNIFIGDPEDIVEAVDNLIESDMPAIAGRYRITANITLSYTISGIKCKYDYFTDNDDDVDYYKDEYLDEAEVTLNIADCTVSNFKSVRI